MVANAAYCELSFSPNVSLVVTVRRFVGEFYAKILDNADITSRLVVATHELLENAVRYSHDGQSSIRVAVQPESGGVRVSIETKNRTSAESRAAVLSLLEEMRASPGRDAFYQTLLRRSAKRDDGSGLGLGRIHAESEMDLACELDDDAVKIRAEARFPMSEVAA